MERSSGVRSEMTLSFVVQARKNNGPSKHRCRQKRSPKTTWGVYSVGQAAVGYDRNRALISVTPRCLLSHHDDLSAASGALLVATAAEDLPTGHITRDLMQAPPCAIR